jgi:hypothetical protein
MKRVGYILTAVAVIVIGYNVWYVPWRNQNTINEHPIVTVLSRGKNLETGYTFRPPLTPFEIAILAIGGIGVALIVIGVARDRR